MFIPDPIFNKIKEQEKYSGVYLFVSNDKQFLKDSAVEFGETLLGYKKADIPLNEKIVNNETDYIPTDIIESFIEFEKKKAVGVKSKFLVMTNIEILTNNVADKMLKTVEEFNKDSLIVFTTTNLAAVSNTIRSRCMIYKNYVETGNFFVQYKTKYIGFIDKCKEADFEDLDDIAGGMINLGALNVLQTLFLNMEDINTLKITEDALSIYLASAKDEQIYKFLVYSFYNLYHDNIKSVVSLRRD